MVRSQKRLVKVQEMMSSEEEKKKQRHKMKRELHLAKEQQLESKNHEKVSNGDRSDSSIGTSTPPSVAGSNVPLPPPPPPPSGAPLPPPSPIPNGIEAPAKEQSKDRSALLGGICNIEKSSLRKTKTS